MKGFIISCKSSWKSKPPTLIPNKPLPPEASCIAKSLKRCFVQSLSVASTLAVAGLQITRNGGAGIRESSWKFFSLVGMA